MHKGRARGTWHTRHSIGCGSRRNFSNFEDRVRFQRDESRICPVKVRLHMNSRLLIDLLIGESTESSADRAVMNDGSSMHQLCMSCRFVSIRK